ncbi:MAG: YdcF family protein [Parafannyhessea sp.]|uniref:YdcF family protein n=1 Tax=Parafannyhessea sp. TaxID=2847324 RepID=UPI003EFE9C99
MDTLTADPLYPLLMALLCVAPVAFAIVRVREERTLWLGFWALAGAASLVVLVEVLLVGYLPLGDHPLAQTANLVVLGILLVMLLAFPVVLVVTLIVTGVRLIRREGVRPANLLSLGLGVAMVAYVLVWPLLRGRLTGLPVLGSVLDLLFGIASSLIGVAGVAFTLYTVSGLVAQVPHPLRRYRYVVALGSGLIDGRRVTPLLAHRVDRAIWAWRRNPGSTIVMSGGQGPDEAVSEASAMRDYAIGQGVPAEAIVCEERSRNTRENVRFSHDLIRANGGEGRGPAKDGRILVVSDDYHVFRALLLTREAGFRADGIGSHVRLYFSLNALVREWVAYVVLRKRAFTAITVVVLVLNVLLWAAMHL